MPHLVKTDRGLYCTNCLANTVLICPDPPANFDKDKEEDLWDFCEYPACSRKIYYDDNEYIHLAQRLLCRECLIHIILSALDGGVLRKDTP